MFVNFISSWIELQYINNLFAIITNKWFQWIYFLTDREFKVTVNW
jgi:hypothetical protein